MRDGSDSRDARDLPQPSLQGAAIVCRHGLRDRAGPRGGDVDRGELDQGRLATGRKR